MSENSSKEQWIKSLKSKYSGKQLTATEVLKFRDELVKKHGEKIIPGLDNDLSEDESLARVEYQILSAELYKVAPKIKLIDNQEVQLFKGKTLLKKVWIGIVVIVPILALLALIKYLFT